MRRYLALLLLVGCGGGSESTPDACVENCTAVLDARGPDAPPVFNKGAHVFQVDVADEEVSATGNWIVIGFDQMNTTLPGIKDFTTGQATAMSLTTSMWSVQGTAAQNWVGDTEWLPAIVGQDSFTSGTTSTGTVTFGGLDGRYRVEVVVAYGTSTTVTHNVAVNGAATTMTRTGSVKNSAAWNPQLDGTNANDWMIWPDVMPANGDITITIMPGRLNAIRLSPPP